MAANKTKPTGARVASYLDARADAAQRADCKRLMALLKRVTGARPRMWGPSIVGYGLYRYEYASGHRGEAPLVGFALRGRQLVIYLLAEGARQKALRARLGPHTMGKSCLYLKRLADLDLAILERLVRGSVAEIRRRHAQGA